MRRFSSLLNTERGFFAALSVFAAAYMIRYFEHFMAHYNTTLFALNYEYGFISRGLVGTLWKGLDFLFPWNLMTYEAVYFFTMGMTFFFYIVLFLFFKSCTRYCDEKTTALVHYLVYFLAIFTFPTFLTEEIFGRLDLYLYMLMIFGVILIIQEKYEWLIVPIGVVCVCIHQGFVFTNANMLLALLFYKGILSSGTRRKKYFLIFAAFFITISILFLYFEFFSHGNGQAIAEDVIHSAKQLSPDGESYNQSIINHEILGLDVYQDEWKYHLYNYKDFPIFLILFSPYLFLGIRFFRHLFQNLDLMHRLAYLAVLGGSITILPEMILKVDYGRYMFILCFYFIAMFLCLLAMKDAEISDSLRDTKKWIRENIPVPEVLYLYPMFLLPFFDVIISGPVHWLSELIFG